MGALEFGGLPGMGVANALPTLLDQAGVAMAAMDGTAHLSMRARPGEKVRNLLISTRRRDGTLRFLRCNATPVPATIGDYRGAVCLVEDATDVATGSPTYSPELPQTMARSFAAMHRATDRLMAFADTLSTFGDADALDRASHLDHPGGVNARVWELPWTDHGATASYRTSSYTVYPPAMRRSLIPDAASGWSVSRMPGTGGRCAGEAAA